MSAASVSTVLKKGLFNDKVAIVTGGGTGIGFEISKELAYLGCTVIIGSRKFNNLKSSATKINTMIKSLNMNNKCIPIQLNIRKSTSIKQFFDTLSNTYNITNINYLVNNAGGQFAAPLHDITENGWKAVIDLNLNGTFLISNYLFNKYWKNTQNKQNISTDKVIINITANSFTGYPVMAHSSAARAGVENLTMVMAQTWSKYGVRINSIAPGTINASGLQTYSEEYRKKILQLTPTGKYPLNYLYRWGECREVSNVVAFMLSPGASFITGASVRVDGGESIYNILLPPQKPLASSKL